MAGTDEYNKDRQNRSRPDTTGDAGTSPGWLYSERGWLALIITSTAAVLLFSVYCLSHGITIIFMHLFYFPIVLLAYRYRYRGFVAAVLLSLAYIALVYFYDPGQPDVITGAWYRFLVFVGIAAVIAYLSEQLMAGRTALEESERKLKLHADFTSDWEFWLDTRGNFVYMTPSCTAITGYTPDEFYADPGTMIRIIHPDDRAAFTRHLETYLTEPRSSSLEFRIIRKDGQIRWIEHVCQSMSDPLGTLIGRWGSNRDITERYGLEEKLRLQNQIFETIAEGINLVRIGDGVIVYTNSKFDRMFGYEKGELAGRHISVVNAPEETMSPRNTADEITRVLTTQGEWRGELRNIKKDGTTFWCLAVISTFNHPEFGNVWISAHTDITARKLAEEAVRAAIKLNSLIDAMSVGECMSYTLDEAERLTFSRIGFFHFVNEGEKTIQLVAWSTETKKHCFIPKEPERQYPVEKAGVWVDCIRQRKPVIQNDYTGLSHKKGIPEGHVPVTRELVVPVFDADKIVAIIGVGNKAGDYDERDIDIIALLAKNAWTLIQRKRAEEETRKTGREWQTTFNAITDAVFLLDDKGRIIRHNRAFETVTGKPAADIDGKYCYDVMHGTSYPFDGCPYVKAQKSRQRESLELKIGNRWFVASVDPVFSENGEISGGVHLLIEITERKRAEEALRQSEERFRTLSETSLTGIYIFLDGVIQYVNPTFAGMYGYTPEEMIGMDPMTLVHPDDRAFVRERMQCRLDHKEEISVYECRMVTRDNRTIHVSIMGAVIPFQGRPAISGNLLDITERKRAEEALRESEERYRTLVESSFDGIVIHRDGIFIYINRTGARLMGSSDPDAFIGKPVLDFVAPEFRGQVAQRVQRAPERSQELIREKFLRLDGTIIDVDVTTTPITWKGRPAAYVTFRDITEWKRAEEALRESEERYRILFDESPISLWEEDLSDIRFWFGTKKEEGVKDFRTYFETHPEDVLSCVRMVNVTRINHASMALFGAHSPQEFSEGLSSVFTPESYDSFREELIAISIGKTWFECEVPLQTVSGERKIAVLKMIVVPGFEQTLGKVVISLLDITERKKMEDALRQANRKLNLLSSITRHDIKNQILILKGFLELSKRTLGDAAKMSEYILKEERTASAIERQILFTKEYEDLGVKASIWQSVDAGVRKAQASLPMRDIRVVMDRPDVEAYADPLLEKVFYNLIDNALRYGGPEMTAIKISAQESDKGLVISVEDDGAGISAEDKKRLFERGFGKNTGLGLFLSREILSITGITITETGDPGKGARFEIIVPKGAYRFSGNQ